MYLWSVEVKLKFIVMNLSTFLRKVLNDPSVDHHLVWKQIRAFMDTWTSYWMHVYAEDELIKLLARYSNIDISSVDRGDMRVYISCYTPHRSFETALKNSNCSIILMIKKK